MQNSPSNKELKKQTNKKQTTKNKKKNKLDDNRKVLRCLDKTASDTDP